MSKTNHRVHRYTSVFSNKNHLYIMNFSPVFSVAGFDKTEVSNG